MAAYNPDKQLQNSENTFVVTTNIAAKDLADAQEKAKLFNEFSRLTSAKFLVKCLSVLQNANAGQIFMIFKMGLKD